MQRKRRKAEGRFKIPFHFKSTPLQAGRNWRPACNGVAREGRPRTASDAVLGGSTEAVKKISAIWGL